MANVTVYLQGGLSTLWLLSGFFLLIPVVVAHKKYADRHDSEQFWRIPRRPSLAPYPLDRLTGAEVESAAAVVMTSEYATPTVKFVMIQVAEPVKTPSLTFTGAPDAPR